MNNAVEWAKKSVGFCVDGETVTEGRKKAFFKELEKEYYGMTNSEQTALINILKTSFMTEDLIYVLSFFVNYMDVKAFRELMMDNLLLVDYDCFLGTMMKLQAKIHISDCYDKHRTLNEKVANKYRELLGMNYEYIPVKERNDNRIVIITEQMLSEKHAPTKVVLDHIYALKKRGFDVVLFVCPCNLVIQEGIWHGAICLNSVSGRENARMIYKDIEFEMHEYLMNESTLLNYKGMLDFIYSYKPVCVYSMGIVNPIAEVVSDFITLVNQDFAIGLPISEAQILIEITNNKEDSIESINNRQIVFKPKDFPMYFENNNVMMSRKELGLPEEKFLIAIVGNRLDEEIDEDFLNVMTRIAKEVPNCCFVMIGNVSAIKNLFDKLSFKNQIIQLGYCEQLIATYKIMDIYLNPKRRGGGFSGAMALVAELPVVTLPDCDVSANVGEKFTVDDYDEMIDTVKRYCYDKEYYYNQKKLATYYSVNNTENKMVEAITERVENIVKIVKKRETNDII